MQNNYDDGNIPEIDLPKPMNVSYDRPQEIPVRTESMPESKPDSQEKKN